MAVLDSYKVSRAIRVLLSTGPVPASARQHALARLKQSADRAVPRLTERLADPDCPAAAADLLLALLENRTLPLFYAGLSSTNTRVAAQIVEILSQGKNYDPNRLLELFDNPEVSKARVAEILSRQRHALDPALLLRLLDTGDKESRTLIFRLVDQVATEALVPELIRRSASEDWLTRLYVTRTLHRFSTEAVRETLIKLLEDPHKAVRQAALEGLAGMQGGVDVGAICKRLRDPDFTVQAKAIETIAQINDPAAVYHLLDILQDESEYVRRAAVEVLNQVGNTSAVKDLLGALRDRDWWVRVRAADALGSIGGPKVVEAVLALVKDADEFIRRCAIEILNTIRSKTEDERIFGSLMGALQDGDWWVRERAIDALAGLGDRRAVPVLLQVMDSDVRAAPVAIRALASLGDPQAIRPLLAHLQSPERAVRAEAIRALAALTDEGHAEEVRRALTGLLHSASGEVRELVDRSLQAVAGRLGGRMRSGEAGAPRPRGSTWLHQSLLADPATVPLEPRVAEPGRPEPGELSAREHFSAQLIDAATLEPGMVLADRYRVLNRIGSGAFGIVILVEDLVVREQIILKFLRPHVTSDGNVIKRFIQELRYARKITHENVIRIYDFITFGKSYAISMEYFPSHSLSAELSRGGPIELLRAFRIVRGVCRGMGVAHQAGIIHRDLKPANILLNDSGLVKIVDFGVAAATSQSDSALTSAGVIVGTPTYMAPEQVQAGVPDPRTDIYSLGIVMYEMFTGRPPYLGEAPMAVLFQHVQGTAIPPRQIRPTLSPALDAMILKAMAVKPAERYQSMEELERALDAQLESEGA